MGRGANNAMSEQEYRQALPVGYHLENYRLAEVLGVGGFGITYRAEHTTLGLNVAIKEYLPSDFAVRDGTTVHPKSRADQEGFEWGLDRFVEEAKTLVIFRHRNLVRVTHYFASNNTAYIVMDYEVGQPFNRLLEHRKTLTESQLTRVVLPIAHGLKVVHDAGYLHRDIKPANIFIRRTDESPVLLDFGAARLAVGRQTRSMTAIASAGYSPPEQYYGADGEQGPWTDIYSLSAVCYRAITGKPADEAPWRQSRVLRSEPDPVETLAGRGGYSQQFLEAIDSGLHLIETDRPPDVDSWLNMFVDEVKTDEVNFSPLTSATKAVRARIQASQPATGSSALSRWNTTWTAAVVSMVLVAVLVVAVFVGPNDAPPQVPPAEPQLFEVVTVPEDADVRIADVNEPYRAEGVMLPSGEHEVVVGATGYETARKVIRHGDRPTRHDVLLALASAPITVVTDPEDANVRIVNGPPYAPKMTLSAGRYEIEVSAPGYESDRISILHGTEPTRHHVALRQAVNSS